MNRLFRVFFLVLSFSVYQGTFFGDSQDTEKSSYSIIKKLKYETSLEYTKMTSGEWWDKIEPYNIYLGSLPLKNKGHLEKIIDLGVTQIFSLIEDFELKDGWFNVPVKAEDWEKNGIGVERVSATDFDPLTKTQIERSIDHLQKMLEEGHIVYVHCKAGRGRSATALIAYLMAKEGFSFDDALALVKKQRPQINLNAGQRQAIFDYFEIDEPQTEEYFSSNKWVSSLSKNALKHIENQNFINEETLANILDNLLYYVINGSPPDLNNHLPKAFSNWSSTFKVQSTLLRRNRYLREYKGNQNEATEAAIKRNHSLTRHLKIMASSALPFVGTPIGYTIALWHQLREITLIAAIHGHDLQDPEVKTKVLCALLGGDLSKIPAASVDAVARTIIKKTLTKAGLQGISSTLMPVHLIFNYLTEDSAKVATYAKELFAGKNSIPVPFKEYIK